MRFIRGDSLKEAIERFHADAALRTRPRASARWSCASCCGGSPTSATRSTTPTAAGCCTATSSRATSSSASTARPWWSTGAWPRPPARPTRRSGERTLRPASASGSAETLPGCGAGHAGLHEPRAGRGRPGAPGPALATSTAWAPRLYCLLTGRPPFAGDDGRRDPPPVRRGEFRSAPARRSVDRPGAGGGLPEGDGACGPRTGMARAGRWPRTSSGGWPTSRSRPGASRLSRRARRWARRHRTAVTGAAAALLAGLIGLAAVAAVQARREHRPGGEEPPAHRGQRRHRAGPGRDAGGETEDRGGAGAVGGGAAAGRGRAGLPQGRRPGGRPARGPGGGLGTDVTVRKAVDAAEPKIAGAVPGPADRRGGRPRHAGGDVLLPG